MSAMSKRSWLRTVMGLLIALVVVAAIVTVWSMARTTPEPMTTGGPTTFRRLNEQQYLRSIEDIFGAGIEVPGRFEPPLRAEGLLAIGDSKVIVTSSGLEQYELRAREIAAQVLAEDKRKAAMPCAPQKPAEFDAACADQFIAKYGRLLFRRPLTEAEKVATLQVVSLGIERSGDFYRGLQSGLSRLLVSPNFIFRVERSQPDAEIATAQRLDDYSLATRISFLLWDAPPDSELLDAAASGALRKQAELNRQVDRLIASPRFEQGVRSFFSDMFAYDQFDGLSKDQSIYPKYSSQLSKDAEEQTLRTIVAVLVTNKGDYRELFTTKKTFMNRALGSLYKIPVDEAAVEDWVPYTFAADDRRAGILTHAAFLMLDPTHEGQSSPTIRGKTVRELLLCQKVPAPPPDVNFDLVQDTDNPLHKTARDRLTAHRENPSCAGCHALTDPIGLGMENYDGIGQYRTHENGAPIDTSGTFEDKSYANLLELQKILRDSPTAANCVAERMYAYSVGRTIAPGEREWLKYLRERFADERYVFVSLMRTVATSKALLAASADAATT
jgi:hypothetical protein